MAGGANVTTQSTSLAVNGHPFQALAIGNDLFVSISANAAAGSQTGIGVYSTASPGLPSLRCTQLSSHPNHAGVTSALGLAATPDGNSILVADDDAGIAAFSRAALGCRMHGIRSADPAGHDSQCAGKF